MKKKSPKHHVVKADELCCAILIPDEAREKFRQDLEGAMAILKAFIKLSKDKKPGAREYNYKTKLTKNIPSKLDIIREL